MNVSRFTITQILRLAKVLGMFWRAGVKFFDIDGEQRAAAFAYYAFFALFPLILLFVTIGSHFWDNATVVNYILANLGQYMPFNESDRGSLDAALHGVADARGGFGALATLGLLWSASHFFHALVRGVNRAWGTIEYPWWRLPLHSMMMLGLVASALFIGVLVPLFMGYLRSTSILAAAGFGWLFDLAALILPSLILFYGLTVLFKFSPRRPTRFAEVGVAALVTTILLQVCRGLFGHYVYELSNFSLVYGGFAVAVVFLMWIYLSGAIIIFGGCVCAAQSEMFGRKGHGRAPKPPHSKPAGQIRTTVPRQERDDILQPPHRATEDTKQAAHQPTHPSP